MMLMICLATARLQAVLLFWAIVRNKRSSFQRDVKNRIRLLIPANSSGSPCMWQGTNLRQPQQIGNPSGGKAMSRILHCDLEFQYSQQHDMGGKGDYNTQCETPTEHASERQHMAAGKLAHKHITIDDNSSNQPRHTKAH
jgi:hypothetical protein